MSAGDTFELYVKKLAALAVALGLLAVPQWALVQDRKDMALGVGAGAVLLVILVGYEEGWL